MSDETIKRPEFALFQKTMERSILSIEGSMVAIAESSERHSQEAAIQNQILSKYIITNEHRHEKADERQTRNEGKLTKALEALEATKKVSDFWSFIWRWTRYIVVGALAATGGILANDYFIAKTAEKPAKQIEKPL